MIIDNHKRVQKGLVMIQMFPSLPGLCACGCGKRLTGRKKRWASQHCADRAYRLFAVLKGDNQVIREEVFERDQGFCVKCGVYDEKWQADHVIEVCNGGGGCTIDNFQTLCLHCHKEKTKELYK